MAKVPGHKALRRGRRSLSGQVYLLTVVTHQRKRVFACNDAAVTAARVCHAAIAWGDAEVLCWVLMPDHWHGLIQLGDNDGLALCANRFKALLAKALRHQHGCDGRLWQRGFHDHALRREENLRTIARYIICNPVRAGLVARVGDYPYWNAAWL
ncbi:MAG: transposase [Xanthomonadaceae bacterium]|nr:transposase [Xanthomonadaceae bacterium]MDP2185777.1 transposase [Xanthomonadales bacterium]MDZ4115344.1 transposase [Xanthomonadaceae bacterium]MDZ4379376.1 transposase [Xanthomonadaceae bacterium]